MGGGGWLIYNRVWERRQGVGYYLVGFFCLFFISLVLLLFVVSCPLSLCFKRLELLCLFLSFLFFFLCLWSL